MTSPTVTRSLSLPIGIYDATYLRYVAAPLPRPWSGVDKTAAEDSGLHRAVLTGNAGTVKNLVTEGADVNENDQDGDPYLQEAVWRGHLEVVQVLIDAGADVNAKDSDGDPLLHEAI